MLLKICSFVTIWVLLSHIVLAQELDAYDLYLDDQENGDYDFYLDELTPLLASDQHLLCDEAAVQTWLVVNEILDYIPFGPVLSRIKSTAQAVGNTTRWTRCDSEGEEAYTLEQITTIASEQAHKAASETLTSYIHGAGQSLLLTLEDLNGHVNDNVYFETSELVQRQVVDDLAENSATAIHLISGAAFALDFEAIPLVLLLGSIALSSDTLAYELNNLYSTDLGERQFYRTELENTAMRIVETLEELEKKVRDHMGSLSYNYIHNTEESGTGNTHRITHTLSIMVGFNLHEASKIVLWEDTYTCAWLTDYEYGCDDDQNQTKEMELINEANSRIYAERDDILHAYITSTFAKLKSAAMAYAYGDIQDIEWGSERVQPSWSYIMSGWLDERQCLDNRNGTQVGSIPHLWNCDLENRNQNWLMIGGQIRSASDSKYCLSVDNNGQVFMDDCIMSEMSSVRWNKISDWIHLSVSDGSSPLSHLDGQCLAVDLQGALTVESTMTFHLSNCNNSSTSQKWLWFSPIKLEGDLDNDSESYGLCLDTRNDGNGVTAHLYGCDTFNQDQFWALDFHGYMRAFKDPNLCFSPSAQIFVGGLETLSCELLANHSSDGTWDYIPNLGALISNENDFCLEADGAMQSDQLKMQYCLNNQGGDIIQPLQKWQMVQLVYYP